MKVQVNASATGPGHHPVRPSATRLGDDALDADRTTTTAHPATNREPAAPASAIHRAARSVAIRSVARLFTLAEPELARLDDFVPEGRVAVDAGTWWGPWSLRLARRVSKVHSFEPNPDLVDRLRTVLPSNVVLHPVALSDRAGPATLWVPRGRVGAEGRATLEDRHLPRSGWTERRVDTSRLDDFELGDVSFVKIDVEGHELEVLHGATKLLEAQHPTILVEVEEHSRRTTPLDAVVEFLGGYAYRGEFLHDGRWLPIDTLNRSSMREVADRVARHGLVTNSILYARRYVHNFLFRPH